MRITEKQWAFAGVVVFRKRTHCHTLYFHDTHIHPFKQKQQQLVLGSCKEILVTEPSQNYNHLCVPKQISWNSGYVEI